MNTNGTIEIFHSYKLIQVRVLKADEFRVQIAAVKEENISASLKQHIPGSYVMCYRNYRPGHLSALASTILTLLTTKYKNSGVALEWLYSRSQLSTLC